MSEVEVTQAAYEAPEVARVYVVDDPEDYMRRAIGAAVFGIPPEAIASVHEQFTRALAAAELRGKRAALVEYEELVNAMWAGGKGEAPDLRDAYDGALARMKEKYQPTEGETPR